MPLHAYSGKCNDLHVYSIRELHVLSFQISAFFSQLVLSTHPLLFYQLLPSHLTVVIFSTVILSNLCNVLFTLFSSYDLRYLRTCSKQVTLYANTLKQTTGVFGQRFILICGSQGTARPLKVATMSDLCSGI